MKFQLKNESFVSANVDAVVLPFVKGEDRLPSYVKDMDAAVGGALSERLKASGFKGEAAQTTMLNTLQGAGPKNVILVGLGDGDSFNESNLRKGYAQVARLAKVEGFKSLAIPYLENDVVTYFFRGMLEGLLLGSYTFDRYKTLPQENKGKQIESISVHFLDSALKSTIQNDIKLAEVFASATSFARDLVNMPAKDLYPDSLAKIVKKEIKGEAYTVQVWNEAEIKKHKMEAFLSVSKGTPNRPKFIHVNFKPSGKARKRIALVGKGVTFDTGGLSLKPPKFMMDMKCDMAGAAVVLAVARALKDLKPNVEVDVIVAATENVPGNDSTRPGDVVKSAKGKTIEVLNTDAEGRLTLADALHYACNLKGVDEVIDLATLTGAAVVATGDLIAAAMTNNKEMLQSLQRCGKDAGEILWHMPLPLEYGDYIKSDVADIKNVGMEGGAAGTITAGLFLQHFVDCNSWIHLDIAGPAFSNRDLILSPKGGTGFGVRTLLNYLSNQ